MFVKAERLVFLSEKRVSVWFVIYCAPRKGSAGFLLLLTTIQLPVVLPVRGEAPVGWNNRLYFCFLVLTRYCFYSVLLVVVDLESSDTYFWG